MKNLFILINCILGAAVCGLFVSNVAHATKAKPVYEVKKRQPRKAPAQEPETRNKLEIPEENREKTIVDADIFNPDRAPNVSMWGRGRTQMTLVGTFKAGKMEGAIILQQNTQRWRSPMGPMGAMMPPGAMSAMMGGMMGGNSPGGPAGPGGGNAGSGGNAGNGRGNAGNGRGNGRGLGSTRQRWSMMNPGFFQQQGGANPNQISNMPVKQYVRVGETLANGYTLVEVTRTRAVLSKGGDKMELELQDPSKNQTQRRTAARPGNASQQLQQAQLQTQQQMLRMMFMMQGRMMNGGGGNAGGGRGGSGGGRGGRR